MRLPVGLSDTQDQTAPITVSRSIASQKRKEAFK